jgi:hypothetical protein
MIKPVVDSWDVFDTLLTRFMPDPNFVFQFLDHKHPGFAAARLAAQKALDQIGKPYVIYEIYAQMQRAGLPETQSRLYLAEELATERALMFPIKSAVSQLAPQDIIVSDMYLSGEHITFLLADICGVHGNAPVIRSNWGKGSSTIWPKLLEHYVIRTHHGDNPHSDHAVPRKFGINCVLRRHTEHTDWEKTLIGQGFDQLARIQREARLRTLEDDASLFETLAAGPYLTLLLAFASYLPFRFGQTVSYGFLSRDADDLATFFRALHPAIPSFNIDISRRLASNPANDAIFRNLLSPGCVLVDLVSTGRSVRGLLDRAGISGATFMTLLFLNQLMRPSDPAFSGQHLHAASAFGGNHFALELLLQSPYPPVSAVALDPPSGGIIRTLGSPELRPAEYKMIMTKTALVTAFLASLSSRRMPPLTEPQTQNLIELALRDIMSSRLSLSLFPSFAARETFSPF